MKLMYFYLIQGNHGPAAAFYPRPFLKAKLEMTTVAPDAKTLAEINNCGGLRLKDGAESIRAVRIDGIPKAPDSYYLPKDIVNEYYLM